MVSSEALQVEVDGAVLHVAVTGTAGPHVVIPHPFQWMDDDGGAVSKLVAGVARSIVVHPRGCGRSTGEDLRTETFVRDLDTVRRAIGADDWIVWGQSGGGTIAMLYALEFPNATRAIILSCTTANGLDASSVYHPGHPDNHIAAPALASSDRATLTPLIAHRPERVLAREDGGGQCAERAAAYFRERRSDLLPLLPQLAMAALVMGGRHDRAIPLHHQERTAAALPNAELIEFQHSGHFPYLEEPERCADEVRAFLAAVA